PVVLSEAAQRKLNNVVEIASYPTSQTEWKRRLGHLLKLKTVLDDTEKQFQARLRDFLEYVSMEVADDPSAIREILAQVNGFMGTHRERIAKLAYVGAIASLVFTYWQVVPGPPI